MSHWRILVAIVILSTHPRLSAFQSTNSTGSASQPTKPADSGDTTTIPKWLPFPISPALYEKWWKYGQWDYKQQGFKYRDFTLFNFGATGGAAGLDQQSLFALAQASKPTADDVNSLDDPELQANFNRNAEAMDKLREMSEQDAHVIRIADDFTSLDSSTKWPRDDIGFSVARWNEYRSLFDKLSLPEGIVRTGDFPGAIFLIARAQGLCTGGSSAGYVYSTNALTPIVKSPKKALDAEARKNPNRHYAYVFTPLKGNWYVFYEVDW
jgi:hypothetical protein